MQKIVITIYHVNFQEKLQGDEFAEKVIFSDEAIFHVSGKVNCHDVCIWGKQNEHEFVEHVHDSLKVNAVSASYVYRLFSFVE